MWALELCNHWADGLLAGFLYRRAAPNLIEPRPFPTRGKSNRKPVEVTKTFSLPLLPALARRPICADDFQWDLPGRDRNLPLQSFQQSESTSSDESAILAEIAQPAGNSNKAKENKPHDCCKRYNQQSLSSHPAARLATAFCASHRACPSDQAPGGNINPDEESGTKLPSRTFEPGSFGAVNHQKTWRRQPV
jgi:hypothetical protein